MIAHDYVILRMPESILKYQKPAVFILASKNSLFFDNKQTMPRKMMFLLWCIAAYPEMKMLTTILVK